MNPQDIFKIRTKKQFESKALELFYLQAKQNPVFKKYIEQLGVNPEKVKSIQQIPFLPIEIFKTQKVLTGGSKTLTKNKKLFLSSGTTGAERSKHYVSDTRLYEGSFRKCFKLFYGDIKQYAILAFLPSYYDNKNSSLLFMVHDMIKRSKKKESRFYQSDEQEILFEAIGKLLVEKKKLILFGVSHALLDLAPHPLPLSSPLCESPSFWRTREGESSLIVLETGGMKGRREEITREELHKTLQESFKIKKIHSEYGMTELLSQAYSKRDGIFKCPPWMNVLIRDANDPFAYITHGKTGAINIIDLANIYSCSFIATQDAGRTTANGSFEVLGRLDNSDLRGCNLLVG